MKLKELLEILDEGQELDIYLDSNPSCYQLDYHYYGKNRYIMKAFDLDFYYRNVSKVEFYNNKENTTVIKVCCI